MNWTWFIDIDIQLFILIPVFVIIYKKVKVLGIIIPIVLVLLSIVYIMHIVMINEFRAGILALENYDIYSELITKPQTRIGSYCIGVLFGFFYERLIQYREETDHQKLNENFFIVKFLHHKKVCHVLFFCANAIVLVCLLVNYQAMQHPYQWPLMSNAFFYGFYRIAFTIAICLYTTVFSTNSFPLLNILMGNQYFRALGRISYSCAIIVPYIIPAINFSLDKSYYIAFLSTIYSLCGNIVLTILSGLLIYLLLDQPTKKAIQLFLKHYPYIFKRCGAKCCSCFKRKKTPNRSKIDIFKDTVAVSSVTKFETSIFELIRVTHPTDSFFI